MAFQKGNKFGAINKGRKFSKEWRNKLSISHKGKKLSEKNKENIRKAQLRIGNRPPIKSGKEHYNWKGGITPLNDKIRKSIEYKLWRKSVFERDNFICQKYGTSGGKLIAHHINNFAEKEDLRLAIDNGITLSEKAHKEFHRLYGIKNNTQEQLIEFLIK